MKKTLLCLIIILSGSALMYGQLTKVGGALSFNTGYYYNLESHPDKPKDHKTGNPIVSLTGIYEISLPLHLKPSINVFIPNITKTEFEKRVISAYSIDLDAHYVFNALDRFELYGLGGLNMLFVRMKTVYDFEEFTEKFTGSNTALGLNLGAGSYIKIKDEFDLFVEVKAIIGKQIQGVLTAGILLNVDWMKKHEESTL